MLITPYFRLSFNFSGRYESLCFCGPPVLQARASVPPQPPLLLQYASPVYITEAFRDPVFRCVPCIQPLPLFIPWTSIVPRERNGTRAQPTQHSCAFDSANYGLTRQSRHTTPRFFLQTKTLDLTSFERTAQGQRSSS